MRLARTLIVRITVACALPVVAGCTPTAMQSTMACRQAFNGTLETIHTLHVQGKLSAKQEQQLLPAILAASSALDQMDSQAAAGNQTAYESALTSFQAANAQLTSATQSSAVTPTRTTKPAPHPSIK
jgi:hypothetical protein